VSRGKPSISPKEIHILAGLILPDGLRMYSTFTAVSQPMILSSSMTPPGFQEKPQNPFFSPTNQPLKNFNPPPVQHKALKMSRPTKTIYLSGKPDYYSGRNAACPLCGVQNDLGKCNPKKWKTFDRSIKPRDNKYNCVTCGVFGCDEKCRKAHSKGYYAMIFSPTHGG
jgi:hypothetical protein